MQAYIPSNESIDLRASLEKRGLGNMNPEYVGANSMDGGGVSKLAANPQGTTRLNYQSQNEGRNLQTNIPGKTVEAARAADREITGSSQVDPGQLFMQEKRLAEMADNPNLRTDSTEMLGRVLSSPEGEKKFIGDIATSRAQNSMLG